MSAVIVIPARLASTRLPEKPLQLIEGKPLVQRTYEAAARVPGISRVIVAADDARIVEAVHAFGGEVILTAPNHPTGTDRLTEVARSHAAELYVNLQCDEPLVRPEDITKLVEGMHARPEATCGTLFHAIDAVEAARTSLVKVVVGARDEALYFSRSPIPFARNPEYANYRKHVGIYAYRRELLARYATLTSPPEELAESLEQLRLLHAGERMVAFEIAPTGPGVDTPEDLEAVRRIVRGEAPPAAGGLAAVRAVYTDVDGVLTDGGLYYDAHGEALKRFHVRDGGAVKALRAVGVRVIAVSGRSAPATRARLDELGFDEMLLGVDAKGDVVRASLARLGITANEAAFVGDDHIDLPAFDACAFRFAPADAVAEVLAKATHRCLAAGGAGVLREVADRLLAARRG